MCRGRDKGPDDRCGRGRSLHGYCCCGGGLRRLREGEEGQLQLDALVAAPGHVLEGVAQRADGPDGLPLAQLRAFFKVLRFLLGRDAGQQALPAGQSRQHQSAVVGDQLLGQTLHVHRLLPQRGQLGQSSRAVLRFQRIRDTEQVAPVGDAGHPADHVGVDLCRDAGAGVKDGECVAHGTVGQPGDQLCAVGGQFQPLLPGNVLDPLCDVLRPDAGEVVPLAAGEDGGRDFLDLRRGEDEDDVGRRLFQRLQQGVEGRCGQHVHLIDDVYLIMAGAGGIGCLVPQVADVVHAVVGGSVHLHHIEDTAVVDAFADLALAAGVAILGMEAVDRLGKDLGAGGLAGAAHAGEKVGVAHAARRHLIAQCCDDATLCDDVLEPLRSPFAV